MFFIDKNVKPNGYFVTEGLLLYLLGVVEDRTMERDIEEDDKRGYDFLVE